jgi:putative hydrolase of the HAD superfamily
MTQASAKASSIVTTAEIHWSFDSQNVWRVPRVIGVPERTRAVLLDALGTLVHFEPPAPLLRAALRERLGIEVSEEAAAQAIRDEIAYYRAHLHEGRDADSLADLRRRSADAMRPALAVDADLTEVLHAALRFHAYPDAAPALEALRARGLAIVVVSNWDHSLHERLAETGLAPLVDGAIASAELGHAKPDRAIFDRALELAGAAPEEALHAGDSPREDVEGALAAGLRAVLVARGERPDGIRVPVVSSLAELPPYA